VGWVTERDPVYNKATYLHRFSCYNARYMPWPCVWPSVTSQYCTKLAKYRTTTKILVKIEWDHPKGGMKCTAGGLSDFQLISRHISEMVQASDMLIIEG